ncbi:hypothetical protein D3C71_1861580 [compost metagenome]
MFEQQLGVFGNAGGDQEESRRGNVRRDFDMAGRQFVARLYAGRAAVDRHRIAEAAQHALGMVAGRRRLGHRGLTIGIQPRQQQA